jgi:hypothetical protein
MTKPNLSSISFAGHNHPRTEQAPSAPELLERVYAGLAEGGGHGEMDGNSRNDEVAEVCSVLRVGVSRFYFEILRRLYTETSDAIEAQAGLEPTGPALIDMKAIEQVRSVLRKATGSSSVRPKVQTTSERASARTLPDTTVGPESTSDHARRPFEDKNALSQSAASKLEELRRRTNLQLVAMISNKLDRGLAFARVFESDGDWESSEHFRSNAERALSDATAWMTLLASVSQVQRRQLEFKLVRLREQLDRRATSQIRHPQTAS